MKAPQKYSFSGRLFRRISRAEKLWEEKQKFSAREYAEEKIYNGLKQKVSEVENYNEE